MSPKKNPRESPLRRDRHIDDMTSHSSAGQDNLPMSRNPTDAKQRGGDNGPAVLKKKLSKRKADAIAREREIRLLATAPIDIPRHALRGANRNVNARGVHPRGRRSDRYLSDVSLSERNSAASSVADVSETYKFKVNAFAALTPRPAVRHVPPHPPTARSHNASAASMRREAVPNLPMTEENYYTKKRVDRLADDLDAGGLRELLERDRRRTEKQQIDDQQRLQRKLERRAEKQRLEEERRRNEPHTTEAQHEQPDDGSRREVEADHADGDPSRNHEATASESKDATAPVHMDTSKETHRKAEESLEDVHAVKAVDEHSNRAQNLRQSRSFAPSQDMGMSQSTMSHSPVRREISTPASSQMYGLSKGSTSDVSRSIDAERRLSDQGGKSLSAFSSLIRRGSSRLKRRYRGHFHETRTNLPTPASHESFFKAPAPSSAPPAFIPPRAFLGSGTINRPHSKFTEHFGDEPISPRVSRLQSPDIPEETTDTEHEESNAQPDVDSSAGEAGAELADGAHSRERSWAADSMDVESENNIPLSQSLASIDSEGSWMSGEFLRRISKRTSNHHRSVGSLRNNLEEQAPSSAVENENEDLEEFTPSPEEARETVQDARQASSNVISKEDQAKDETSHGETRKRPVLVTPANRPKSTQGLLNDIQSLSPVSADEGSPIEPLSAEIHHVGVDGGDTQSIEAR